MHAKIFTAFLTALTAFTAVNAQKQSESDSLSRQLQEIIVSAKQPATKLVGSTLVSTIVGTNLSSLGSALDVMAQLPLLKVQDNSVSVIGKSDIEIYIDGRPLRDEAELRQLRSSELKKVELLMAPGAAYESSTGAVIKITTNRNFISGLSLTEMFQFQQRRRSSTMEYLGAAYRTGNWELFVNGTVSYNNSLSKGRTINTLVYDGTSTTVGSSQCNSHPTLTGVVKAGINYSKGEQSLGAYYRYNPERGDFSNKGTEWFDNAPELSRQIDKHIRSHSHLASVYYENLFADKVLLHFDGDFRQSEARNRVITSYLADSYPEVKSTDLRRSTLWAGKLYVNLPLWDGNFTAGTQDSHTHTSLDYHMATADIEEYIPSTQTDARQTSAALFATWSRIFGKFSLSVGTRYEYVDFEYKTDGQRDKELCFRSHLLTPDLSFGYSFNDNAQLSLSYKMTSQKPPYSQLTGSLSYVGLHEIEGGNPALRDEKLHDLQLFGMWKDFMFQADFMRSLDAYAYAKQLYPANNLQLIMQPVNINVSVFSMYLIWSKSIGCWSPNITAGFYRQWLTLDRYSHNKPIVSYYFDNTISLPRGWSLTANISGRTAGDMHTNHFGATAFTMDASIGKTLFNKALTLKLSATDIFNTANNNWTMETFGIHVDKRQSYDRRGIALDIIYNFQPRKSAYKGDAAAEAELRRL